MTSLIQLQPELVVMVAPALIWWTRPPHSLHSQVHLYADDTVLYCSASNIDSAINRRQLSFHMLEKQLSDLKLVLNCAKTKWIICTKVRSADFNSLKLCYRNGTTLERVTSYKYLGIWVDEKLDFKGPVTP